MRQTKVMNVFRTNDALNQRSAEYTDLIAITLIYGEGQDEFKYYTNRKTLELIYKMLKYPEDYKINIEGKKSDYSFISKEITK